MVPRVKDRCRALGSRPRGFFELQKTFGPSLSPSLSWEFPKIGKPQYSTLNSGILIIRTPTPPPPIFSETPISGFRGNTSGLWLVFADKAMCMSP